MAQITEKQLLNLKNSIKQSQSEISELQGRKKYIIQQLKTDWECNSIKEAKQKLNDFKEKVDKIDSDIESKLEDLAELYNFDEGEFNYE